MTRRLDHLLVISTYRVIELSFLFRYIRYVESISGLLLQSHLSEPRHLWFRQLISVIRSWMELIDFLTDGTPLKCLLPSSVLTPVIDSHCVFHRTIHGLLEVWFRERSVSSSSFTQELISYWLTRMLADNCWLFLFKSLTEVDHDLLTCWSEILLVWVSHGWGRCFSWHRFVSSWQVDWILLLTLLFLLLTWVVDRLHFPEIDFFILFLLFDLPRV